jgi:hypothetical protein
LLPAHQLYASLLALGMPVAPLGTPAADAFLALKTMAGSAFGVLGAPKDVVTAPSNWFDAAGRGGWSSFSTTSSGSSGSSGGSSGGATPRPAIPLVKTPRPTKPAPGETPPIIAQEQFEQLWQWRKLDPAAMVNVVMPASKTVEAAPAATAKPVMTGSLKIQPDAVVRDHRTAAETPIVRDHRALDISDVSVAKAQMASFTAQPTGELKLTASPKLAMRTIDAAPVITKSAAAAPVDRIMASAPRRQFTDLVDAEPVLVTSADSAVKSQAMAKLIADRSPALIADLKRDSETTSTQRVESQNLTLSLEYCFVQISRDAWWNEVLVRLPGWCAPGLRAGDLVPGRQGTGLSVGVPIAMVVTRNVRVSGRWSEADRAAADSHTSFGPWEMSRSKMSFDKSQETATLEIPDTQVVAVVCSLLPSLPPADDPALVASKLPPAVPPVISLTPETS